MIIERLRDWNERSKRWAESISLSRKYPNYFRKWIFRGCIVVLLVLWGALFLTDGAHYALRGGFYMECNPPKFEGASSFESRCVNPFYDARYTNSVCQKPEFYDMCQKEYFMAGESFGQKPSWLARNSMTLAVLITAAAFGLNHLLYMRRTR